MKKIAIALLMALIFVCGACLVACSPSVFELYIFDLDGQTIDDEEFTLPRVISEKSAVWTSSNEDIIKITDRSAEEKDFLATVTRPESERAEVKLTVTVEKESKTYSVYVEPIDVYSFANAFKFKQSKATVTKDFDLPTSTTIGSKTATIAWTITSEYSQYIKLNNEGNKCLVTTSSLDPEVRIRAKFTYQKPGADKAEETTMIYRFTVSIEKTPLESMDYWYNNTGVSIDMSGWIVAIATAYSEQYKNITFYMVDENLNGGYYLYHCAVSDKAVGNGLGVGSYVKVTNTTNTNYNGLVETNAGGSLSIDASKNKTEAQMKELCYALDNDILGKVPEAIYHTSQYVSLTNWEITSDIDLKKEYGTTDTFFTIKKNGIEVKVNASKYLEGVYKAATDKKFTDIVAAVKGLKKGDLIDIRGILGNNKGYTIIPIDASNIVKNTNGADSDDVIKALPGVVVGNFINTSKTGLKAVLDAAGLNLIVTKAKDVQLPASSEDVTVKYSILGVSDIISLDNANNKLVIADIPHGLHERVHLQIDLSSGSYKTTVFQYVEIWGKTEQEMVDDEHLQLFIDDIKVPGQVNLPIVGSIYGANVTIRWEMAEESDLAEIVTTRDYTPEKNITGQSLAVKGHPQDYVVKIKATITVGEVTKEKVLEIKVSKFIPSSKVEDKDGKKVLTIDTKGDFNAYSGAWTTSYKAQEITNETLTLTAPKFKLNISNCDKQSATITDMPNMAAKSNNPAYVSLSIDNATISSITFNLKEWSDSKLFTAVYVEYTTDATATNSKDDASKWVAIENVGWKDVEGGKRIGKDGLAVTANEIPATAVQVRLVLVGATTSNTQVGLQSVVATYAAKA